MQDSHTPTHFTHNLAKASFYGILDLNYVLEKNAIAKAEELLASEVDILQLRAKNLPKDKILNLAKSIAPLAKKAGKPFIINDHCDIAYASRADGLHLGQDDMPISKAKKILRQGNNSAIIGKSTHNLEQAKLALTQELSYIAFGPIFATATKPEYRAVGLEHVAQVAQMAKQSQTPVFFIGGINLKTLEKVRKAGAERVVIVSDFLQANDHKLYAQKIKKTVKKIERFSNHLV